jgi:hypothetical protein
MSSNNPVYDDVKSSFQFKNLEITPQVDPATAKLEDIKRYYADLEAAGLREDEPVPTKSRKKK